MRRLLAALVLCLALPASGQWVNGAGSVSVNGVLQGGSGTVTAPLTLSPVDGGTAITIPQPDDQATITLFKTTPPAGATHTAPFEMVFSSYDLFGGEPDPALYFGYNVRESVVTEPTMLLAMEGNYYHGRRDFEMYPSISWPGGFSWRPWMIIADKADPPQFAAMVINSDSFNVGGISAGQPLIVSLAPFDTNQNAQLNYGGTSGMLYINNAGGSAGVSIASDSRGSGFGGSVSINGSIFKANTGAEQYGTVNVVTGPEMYERLRVQVDGQIAVNKPNVVAGSQLDVTGNARVAQLGTVTTPAITNGGTPGATTYGYKVVAKLADGTTTSASTEGTTTTGNATLSATNYNIITWNRVSGANTYDVYRTVGGATQGKIATDVPNGFWFTYPPVALNDTGLSGDSGTAPAKNGTGTVTASQYRLSALNTAPANATEACTLGEIRIAANFFYLCSATNTWVRAALTTW